MKEKSLSKLLGSKKALAALLCAAVCGILLMTAGGGKKTAAANEISEYERQVENKIEQTVRALCGGKVYVIVTAEYGRETQYVKNTSPGTEQTVISAGAPVAARTVSPAIRGITVVCRNGSDPAVCRKITEALSCAYGVSSAKIYVTSVKQ